MSGPPVDPRVGDLLQPEAQEVEALGAAPPWLEGVAAATEPGEHEVEALLARAGVPRRGGRRLLWVTLAAAALALFVLLPRGPEELVLQLEVLTLLEPGSEAVLTPAATVSGAATVRLVERTTDGAQLRLEAGRAVFEVDPAGQGRGLTVLAGEVSVSVTGTRFVVSRDGPEVHVAVERGSVAVDWPEGHVALVAGQSWTGPPLEAAALLGPVVPQGVEIPGLTVTEPRGRADPQPAVSRPVDLPRDPEPVVEPLPEPEDAEPQAEADPPPASAPSAARAWARLLDEREHDTPPLEVLAHVEDFLATWPDSPLVPEAQLFRMELQARHTDPLAAAVILEHWLRSSGDEAHRPEVLLLHASVAVGRLGDCSRAKDSLDELAALGGPLGARAQAFTTACAPP